MKKHGFLLCVLFFLAITVQIGAEDKPAAGDKVTITETVFVPPLYYVGDLVELRITLLAPPGTQVVKSRELPSLPWVQIKNVDVRHEAPYDKVIVQFVSFAPGTKTLPSLPLGDVVLSEIRIFTSSILEKNPGAELAPPRDQLAFPQTELFFFLVLLVVIVLPLLAWRFAGPAQRAVQKILRQYDRKRPIKNLLKAIKQLQQKGFAIKGPEFYTEFSLVIRTYLSQRFQTEMDTLTAAELEERLKPLPAAWASEWARLVHKADIVRFDSQNPPEHERLEDLESLRNEAARLETKEVAHVDL